MKSRIPKKAQRLIDACKSVSDKVSERVAIKLQVIPTRMEVGVTPLSICNRFDVYFNGVKQTRCTVADTVEGYITRYAMYKSYDNLRPLANEQKHSPLTETLYGDVRIVLKGKKP